MTSEQLNHLLEIGIARMHTAKQNGDMARFWRTNTLIQYLVTRYLKQ